MDRLLAVEERDVWTHSAAEVRPSHTVQGRRGHVGRRAQEFGWVKMANVPRMPQTQKVSLYVLASREHEYLLRCAGEQGLVLAGK